MSTVSCWNRFFFKAAHDGAALHRFYVPFFDIAAESTHGCALFLFQYLIWRRITVRPAQGRPCQITSTQPRLRRSRSTAPSVTTTPLCLHLFFFLDLDLRMSSLASFDWWDGPNFDSFLSRQVQLVVPVFFHQRLLWVVPLILFNCLTSVGADGANSIEGLFKGFFQLARETF